MAYAETVNETSAIGNPYAQEAEERWPSQYRESQRRLSKLSSDEQRAVFNQHEAIATELAELFKAGAAAESTEVQALIGRHYDWITNFWTPSREAYVGLGQMYAADERFTANYDKFAAGLAVFMSSSMTLWADANLV